MSGTLGVRHLSRRAVESVFILFICKLHQAVHRPRAGSHLSHAQYSTPRADKLRTTLTGPFNRNSRVGRSSTITYP